MSVDLGIAVDVADPDAVRRAVERIQHELGPIAAVVTAAGHHEIVPFSDISSRSWERMLRVHLGGLRNVVDAVLPEMLQRKGGSIVAIASELAIGGGNGEAHYAAAKGAVIGLVRSLAIEVAADGVRVNSVAPGPTDTAMLPADAAERSSEYLTTLPARRLGRPQEIAAVVKFLLTEADFFVGEVLSPNCGAGI